ncbi:unnamed protein product [Linum trigynum]|uniref:Myb/SANT-like domain-containing protein n=1 Tax=Linum trigynum TaxID=586398 RepID=A0AAV2CCS7_9ROSI
MSCRMGRKRCVGGDKDGATSSKYTFWPEKLDKPLVECILELMVKGIILDGNCKNGGYDALEKMLEQKVPGCGMRAKPNIEGRYKGLKKKWHAFTFMRNQSGWGWDEVNKCVICPYEKWDKFEEKHPNCGGLNKKSFPVYDDLTPVFAKGRASGEHVYDIDPPGCGGEPIEDEASSDGTAGKKKKRSQSVDDRIDFVVGEMSELRPMIKQSMETIARALGESDDLIEKRTNLLKTLEELEGITRAEILTALRKLSNNDRDLMIFYGLEDKADKLMFVTGLLG